MTITLPDIDESEVDTVMDQLVADLRGARDIIAEFGFVQHTYGLHDYEPACIVGAVLRATGSNTTYSSMSAPRIERAVYALASTLGLDERNRRSTSGLSRRFMLYRFNDDDVTTEADVMGLFNTTIGVLER